MSNTHELKCWPVPFRMVRLGAKRFEYRRDDRGFCGGDLLLLREYVPGSEVQAGMYTGAELLASVNYLARGPDFGIPAGFVCMSITVISAVGCQANE